MARQHYRIIINKGKTKEKLLFFLSLPEMILCTLIFVIVFRLFAVILGDLYGLVVGAGATLVCGSLFIELPNHLNMLQHIKLGYKHYFVDSREYFYYKDFKNEKEEVIDEPIKKIETRYKAEGEKKKKRTIKTKTNKK